MSVVPEKQLNVKKTNHASTFIELTHTNKENIHNLKQFVLLNIRMQ